MEDRLTILAYCVKSTQPMRNISGFIKGEFYRVRVHERALVKADLESFKTINSVAVDELSEEDLSRRTGLLNKVLREERYLEVEGVFQASKGPRVTKKRSVFKSVCRQVLQFNCKRVMEVKKVKPEVNLKGKFFDRS